MSVSVLERRGAPPASFSESGIRGVATLLLIAVGAVGVSIRLRGLRGGKGKGRRERMTIW